jgi:putative transposase
MKYAKKIAIKLTKAQEQKVNQNFGILRFLWNKYIEINNEEYNKNKRFVFSKDFNKYVVHVLSKECPWIKKCPSKARQEIIRDAERSLKAFFNKQRGFIKLKSKHKNPVTSMFFIKNGIRFMDESHVWIPTIGGVKLKEKNYLKYDDIPYITSGRISQESDGWYVVFIIDSDVIVSVDSVSKYGMGIDLGIKDFATIFNGERCEHIPCLRKINQNMNTIEKKITKLQKVISHKEKVNLNKYGYDVGNKIKKGEATKIYHTTKIRKLRKRAAKLNKTLVRIRKDYIRKVCLYMVKSKPKFITIEDLHIQEMLQYSSTHTLAKHLQESLLYYFRTHLMWKCEVYGIELRLANQFFASSKICSNCGHKKKRLKLYERVYRCKKCGFIIDRDENASINLYNLDRYQLA